MSKKSSAEVLATILQLMAELPHAERVTVMTHLQLQRPTWFGSPEDPDVPRPGTCKSPRCLKPIWWRDLKGRLHPFDDPEGKVSHFATCPDAAKFRKPTKNEGKTNE